VCEIGAVKQGYQYQISCLLMVVVGVPKCGASSTMPIMVMVHATAPTNRRPTICERGTSLYYSYVEGYVVDLVNLPNLRAWLLNEYSANQ
jgi:hypothetical protein